MTTKLEVLEAGALQRAPSDRSHLLERLIANLDSDPETEAAWEQEAERREERRSWMQALRRWCRGPGR